MGAEPRRPDATADPVDLLDVVCRELRTLLAMAPTLLPVEDQQFSGPCFSDWESGSVADGTVWELYESATALASSDGDGESVLSVRACSGLAVLIRALEQVRDRFTLQDQRFREQRDAQAEAIARALAGGGDVRVREIMRPVRWVLYDEWSSLHSCHRILAAELVRLNRAGGRSGANPSASDSPAAQAPPARSKRESANEERDAWLYDGYVAGRDHASTLTELKMKREWQHLDRPSAITKAVQRFALRHGLPVPKLGQGLNHRTRAADTSG